MMTIDFGNGCTATLTRKTADALLLTEESRKAYYNSSKYWEEEGRRKWLADPKNWGSTCYSDIYKDEYGVRPR